MVKMGELKRESWGVMGCALLISTSNIVDMFLQTWAGGAHCPAASLCESSVW